MQQVHILDKLFDLYIPYDEIQRRIDSLAERINADFEGQNPLFVIMLSGAFMFASELTKRLKFPADIAFVKFSSYAGTQSTDTIKEQLALERDVSGRTVVIIEDIVESGLTMHEMLRKLRLRHAKDIKIVAAFAKPQLMRYDVHIDYKLMDIDDDFIVGFGMDYNQCGRNLPSVYKIRN